MQVKKRELQQRHVALRKETEENTRKCDKQICERENVSEKKNERKREMQDY